MVSEPGWEPDESPPESRAEAAAATAGPRHAAPSQASKSPESDQASPTRTGGSFPESSDPNVLTALLAEGLAGLSSLVSIATRRRFGMSVNFQSNEAKAIARPIARLIQRRANVKSDLNDAADATGVFAGLASYIERIVTAPGVAPVESAGRHAAPPASTSTLLSDDAARKVSPAPPSTPAATAFRRPGREVGAGPMKDAIQGL